MSIDAALYLSQAAGDRQHVADELYAIIRLGLADDAYRAADLVDKSVVLLSGLLIDVSTAAYRRGPVAVSVEPTDSTEPGQGAAEVSFRPAVAVGFLLNKARQLGVFDKFGEFDEWEPQHADMVQAVVALLGRVRGPAVFRRHDSIWLVRTAEGRLLVNDRFGWRTEHLAAIPRPYFWASLDWR
jgi:hypothetical protein